MTTADGLDNADLVGGGVLQYGEQVGDAVRDQQQRARAIVHQALLRAAYTEEM
jgi:hypothetical protein